MKAERELFVLGAASLYFELLVVRWTNGYVRNVGFFTSFLVLASMVGLGVGMLVAKRFAERPSLALFPLVVLAYCGIVYVARPALMLHDAGAVFWGDYDPERNDPALPIDPEVFVCIAYVMVVLMFAPIGHALGLAFEKATPLRGYFANVAGSLFGIVLFSIGSFVLAKPVVWFGLVFAAILPLAHARAGRRDATIGAVVAALLTVGFVGWLDIGSTWSPYYRTQVKCFEDRTCAFGGNGVWGMHVHPYRPGRNLYNEVYGDGGVLTPRTFDEVLVIGAGGGNDVNVALHHGAKHVDAVEINESTLVLGRKHHPDHPYDSPKVTTFVDDGRAFLKSHEKTYDLVLYALPDSTGTVSSHANMRVESYLFTVEAFRAVRARLKPDGVFAIYNHFRQLWIVDKIAAMLGEAFEEPPLVFADRLASAVLVAGPGARSRLVGNVRRPESTPPPATDDWPFLYLVRPHLPSIYARTLGVIALLTLLFVGGAAWLATRFGDQEQKKSPRELLRLDGPMFFMGAAFMLLEAKSIVTFGLLFGSTWLTTALVIAGILVMVLVAIGITTRTARTATNDARSSIGPWAIALGAALALVYLLPPERLVVGSVALRWVLGTAAALSPVLFANVIFARLLGEAKETARSLASNLLGAVVGGIAEYAALAFGYRALLLVVAGFYGAAFVLVARRRRPPPAERTPQEISAES